MHPPAPGSGQTTSSGPEPAPSPSSLSRFYIGPTEASGAGSLGNVAASPIVGPRPHDVAHRQDPRQFAPLDDDQMGELAADHRRGGLLERPVRGGEGQVGREVVRDALLVGILT